MHKVEELYTEKWKILMKNINEYVQASEDLMSLICPSYPKQSKIQL